MSKIDRRWMPGVSERLCSPVSTAETSNGRTSQEAILHGHALTASQRRYGQYVADCARSLTSQAFTHPTSLQLVSFSLHNFSLHPDKEDASGLGTGPAGLVAFVFCDSRLVACCFNDHRRSQLAHEQLCTTTRAPPSSFTNRVAECTTCDASNAARVTGEPEVNQTGGRNNGNHHQGPGGASTSPRALDQSAFDSQPESGASGGRGKEEVYFCANARVEGDVAIELYRRSACPLEGADVCSAKQWRESHPDALPVLGCAFHTSMAMARRDSSRSPSAPKGGSEAPCQESAEEAVGCTAIRFARWEVDTPGARGQPPRLLPHDFLLEVRFSFYGTDASLWDLTAPCKRWGTTCFRGWWCCCSSVMNGEVVPQPQRLVGVLVGLVFESFPVTKFPPNDFVFGASCRCMVHAMLYTPFCTLRRCVQSAVN